MSHRKGRSALVLFGLACLVGLAQLLHTAVSPRPVAASAQAGRCDTALIANVRTGPDAGLTVAGLLRLEFDAEGVISGRYEVGTPEALAGDYPVVGQTSGHAIALLITIADGAVIVGTGALERPLGECRGEMLGPLVGPLEGDTGDWLGSPGCVDVGGNTHVCMTATVRCTISPRDINNPSSGRETICVRRAPAVFPIQQ